MSRAGTVYICLLALSILGSLGCNSKKSEQANAALEEWNKVQTLCEEGKGDEASAIGEKLRDENEAFSEAVYEQVKNEPGYPGPVNWCSPILIGGVTLKLLEMIE